MWLPLMYVSPPGELLRAAAAASTASTASTASKANIVSIFAGNFVSAGIPRAPASCSVAITRLRPASEKARAYIGPQNIVTLHRRIAAAPESMCLQPKAREFWFAFFLVVLVIVCLRSAALRAERPGGRYLLLPAGRPAGKGHIHQASLGPNGHGVSTRDGDPAPHAHQIRHYRDQGTAGSGQALGHAHELADISRYIVSRHDKDEG